MGATRPTLCEGWPRNARHHVKNGIGGNSLLYSRTPLLSRGFAKKYFLKKCEKVLTSPAGCGIMDADRPREAEKREEKKTMEYIPKRRVCVYDLNFREMPAGEEIATLCADDSAAVTLPDGRTFHTGADGLRVRVMRAEKEEDRGSWVFGNRGGRLYI